MAVPGEKPAPVPAPQPARNVLTGYGGTNPVPAEPGPFRPALSYKQHLSGRPERPSSPHGPCRT